MRLEHHQQPSGKGMERRQRCGDLVRVVTEIVDYRHVARCSCHFKAALQAGEARKRDRRFRQRHAHHRGGGDGGRSEEHTSELQSLMRTSYAVFCWKKKNSTHTITHIIT